MTFSFWAGHEEGAKDWVWKLAGPLTLKAKAKKPLLPPPLWWKWEGDSDWEPNTKGVFCSNIFILGFCTKEREWDCVIIETVWYDMILHIYIYDRIWSPQLVPLQDFFNFEHKWQIKIKKNMLMKLEKSFRDLVP